MNAARIISKSLLISPELLIILLGLGIWTWWPTPLEYLAGQAATAGEVLRFIGLLAVGLVAYDIAAVKSILLPEDDRRHHLQHWPRYFELRVTALVGLFYAILFAGSGVIASFLDWTKPTAAHAALLLVAVVGGLTTAGSLFLAQLSIGILLRKHTGTGTNGLRS